jgi:hypothetical protein
MMIESHPTEHDLSAAIEALDDQAAMRILAAVTRRPRAFSRDEPMTTEAVQALCAEWSVTPVAVPAPAGEIARQALLVLMHDPDLRGPILAMIRNPEPRQFALDPVSGTLLITFALFALQSHVEFSRDKQGRWEFKFKKAPSKERVAGPLIRKLIALISGGPPKTT